MMLITGGGGKLGRELAHMFPDAQLPSRGELNILDKDSVEMFVSRIRPDVVIHAAAYTSVSRAEQEKDVCWNTNVRGTEYLIDAVKKVNPQCHVVYVSTACVFYGDRGMYAEDDIPSPKNFYALTKLIGEYVVRRMEHHLIVRTNFVAREPWPYPRAFSDRFGTYLYADAVARTLGLLIQSKKEGLVHLAGNQKMSMYDLARFTSPDVEPMTMADTKDPLTKDMTLTSKRIPTVEFEK
jgi:dTDP-4-dehydrorhamnose reductase